MGFKVYQDGKETFEGQTYADLLNGYLVKAMSVQQVTSGLAYEAYVSVDKCDAAGDIPLCVGVNIGSTTSGNPAHIARDGIYLMYAGGAVPAGDNVGASGGDPLSVVTATAGSNIGHSLSEAASGEQVVVALGV
jgi:hypothetical protein